MFCISTDSLRPGMRLGKPVIASDGRQLLHAGTELQESYIQILRRLRIPGVYITNDLAPDVEPEDVVSPQTRQALAAGMRQAMGEIQKAIALSAKKGQRRFSGTFDTSKLKSGVDAVVTDLLKNPRALVNLQDIRTADEYTMGHSVNVCVLSVLMGMSLNYTEKQLNELGMGTLMHDIGKVAVAPQVLHKDGPLTPEEYEQMKEHTSHGWEILSKQPEISYVSAAIALQHHERWAGGGYPRGISGDAIHEYARICAVADVYDAMVADRVYRKGHHPLRALKIMTELTADYFEPRILDLFAECVAVYPVGSLVELTGSYQAVVVSVERGKNLRPRVRVVRDVGGAVLARPVEIDLSVHPAIQILRTVQEEAPEFLPELVS